MKSIALVDVSYVFALCWHGTPRDAAPGECAQTALDRIAGIRATVDHVVCCLDAPPYRRKDILPSYKGHREKPADDEVNQKRWLLGRLEADGYSIARVKGYEADDLLATLALAYAELCDDVRLISADKDVAACVTDKVRMYVPAVGDRPSEIRGPAEIKAKFGVEPKDMPLWLALVGDSSDGIPGVPSVGPKKAAAIIADCKTMSGIAEALATAHEGEKPSAMWQSIADNWEQLQQSYRLVTLEIVPIDALNLLKRREQKPLVEDEMSEPVVEEQPIAEVVEKTTTEQRELAKSPDGYGLVSADLQPQDLRSAQVIAKWLHNSRLYARFPSPEAIFAVLMRGRELGIGAMTALDSFHVVEGKPVTSAHLIMALAQRDPNCEYFALVSSSSEQATYETKHRRHPGPATLTYSIDQARTADLIKPRGGWSKHPADMLRKTAGAKLARAVYQGATLGLYCGAEMGDDE